MGNLGGGDGACESLSRWAPVGGASGPGAVTVAAAGASLAASLALLLYLWHVRRAARRGDERAAFAAVLPQYLRLFAAFCLAAAARAAALVALAPLRSGHARGWPLARHSWASAAAAGAGVAAYHLVTEGVACLLVQRGAGGRSVARAALAAASWALASGAVTAVALSPALGDDALTFALLAAWHGALVVFYAVLRLAPRRLFFRRPALNLYSAFLASLHAAELVALVLVFMQYSVGLCAAMGVWAFYGLAVPPVLYVTLRNDSAFWSGAYMVGYRRVPTTGGGGGGGGSGVASDGGSGGGGGSDAAGDKQRALEAARPPVLSSSASGAASAWAAAHAVASGGSRGRSPSPMVSPVQSPVSPNNSDGGAGGMYRGRGVSYNVMSPLLGQHLDAGSARELASGMDALGSGVRLINFAYLSLGRRLRVLGAGGTSRVFRGKLKGQPVAVKMIYCISLTPQVVANFVEEARVMSALRHGNVVRLVGVCVAPPSLCIVMELVEGGTLFDLLHPAAAAAPGRRARAAAPPLGWSRRFALAAGCARAVAYLHTQRVTHMDVKSLNFLLTRDGQVKLCDFEWSHRAAEGDEAAAGGAPASASASASSGSSPGYGTGGSSATPSPGGRHRARGAPDADTLNWMPPEAMAGDGDGIGGGGLDGGAASSAAAAVTARGDVYSLGMVLYEVFTGQIPFREYRGRRQLRRAVLSGVRPRLPSNMPPPLASLLVDAWHADPARRPSAAEVLARLNEARASMAILLRG